jgi:hypothetical protein
MTISLKKFDKQQITAMLNARGYLTSDAINKICKTKYVSQKGNNAKYRIWFDSMGDKGTGFVFVSLDENGQPYCDF